MNRIVSRFKMSLVIGAAAIMLVSCISVSVLPHSWFITGLFSGENENGITVINDEDEDVEFGFGLFDLIARMLD